MEYSPISRPSKTTDCPLSLPSDSDTISPDLSSDASIPTDDPYKGLKREMALNVARRRQRKYGPEVSL